MYLLSLLNTFKLRLLIVSLLCPLQGGKRDTPAVRHRLGPAGRGGVRCRCSTAPLSVQSVLSEKRHSPVQPERSQHRPGERRRSTGPEVVVCGHNRPRVPGEGAVFGGFISDKEPLNRRVVSGRSFLRMFPQQSDTMRDVHLNNETCRNGKNTLTPVYRSYLSILSIDLICLCISVMCFLVKEETDIRRERTRSTVVH